ncbi:MAG TPA: bifunctional hydroxymethylpyrimidine kinase/phosphomethylpyrimidine kinase [Terriglobales bacterium]|nr:bifunctional hydroxymethylpyrimidine kinase/phosphomethylpyrimidine kinase [Terriglobales bacterium]
MDGTHAPPIVLSIAGYDPSSGAGITADIKTAASHGCYAVTCITALTVQSTQGVKSVVTLNPELVKATLEELAADVDLAAVRIGMLGSGPVATAVADFLESAVPKHVVLDPVLSSSSGVELLDQQGVTVLRERLLRLAKVVTPNLNEAEALTGMRVRNVDEMKAAALRLHELGARGVVITGGHLAHPAELVSLEADSGRVQKVLTGERIESRSTHGTGCAFAMALACNLALGKQIGEAVAETRDFVREAISSAHPIGRGTGPLNLLLGR